MIDMDYEKAYEEALKRAEAAINIAADKDLVKGVATTIFPELRESEDERIRKYFIWIVNNVLNNIQGLKLSNEQTRELIENYDGIKVSDILAYLEKQKDSVSNAKYIEDVANAFEDGRRKGEQKEQKPINLHDKIEELCSKYPINKHSMSDGELSSYHQGVHLGATKIAEYLSKQKLIEWREEDEDMRDTIIRDLKFLGGDMANISPAYKEEVDWLNSLPERFGLKPEREWSEEDKTMINHIIEALPRWANGQITILPSQAEEYVKRLKTLRPQPKVDSVEYERGYLAGRGSVNHWKPSEEQMEALRRAVNKLAKSDVADSVRLSIMYDNLKEYSDGKN